MGICAGLYIYVVVVQTFTFAISSPDEFLLYSSDQIDADSWFKSMSVLSLSCYESDVRITKFWQSLPHKMAEKQLA